jgi:hypothetical protein
MPQAHLLEILALEEKRFPRDSATNQECLLDDAMPFCVCRFYAQAF